MKINDLNCLDVYCKLATAPITPTSQRQRNCAGVRVNIGKMVGLPDWWTEGGWVDKMCDEVKLAFRVKNEGYPNIYGAKIPVKSGWNLTVMRKKLVGYVDHELVDFLEFGWPSNRLPNMPFPTMNTCNHSSATMYPSFVQSYIIKQCQLGHIIGPFWATPFVRTGVSPLSTRPKKDLLDRRTILDLSFPEGASVNDYTPKDNYLGHNIQLRYPTVDDLAIRISEVGPTCRIYRKDLLGTFLQIPLDPADVELFAFCYDDMMFFFKMLVMGHRISPYICQRVTSSISYLHRKKGFFLLNYIDDFAGAEPEEMAERA